MVARFLHSMFIYLGKSTYCDVSSSEPMVALLASPAKEISVLIGGVGCFLFVIIKYSALRGT
jgi:hypothetical protein